VIFISVEYLAILQAVRQLLIVIKKW